LEHYIIYVFISKGCLISQIYIFVNKKKGQLKTGLFSYFLKIVNEQVIWDLEYSKMLIISLLMYVSNTKWLVQLLKLVIFILNKLANWAIDKGRTSSPLIYFFHNI